MDKYCGTCINQWMCFYHNKQRYNEMQKEHIETGNCSCLLWADDGSLGGDEE